MTKDTDNAGPVTADSSSDSKRISVVFTGDLYQALVELSQDKPMSDVIRDSIILEKWIHDARRDGYRVLLEKDGKVRELMLR
jgi:hypothetical protein